MLCGLYTHNNYTINLKPFVFNITFIKNNRKKLKISIDSLFPH